MKNINELMKSKDGLILDNYENFTELAIEYYRCLRNINTLEIKLKDKLESPEKSDAFSLKELIDLYYLVQSNIRWNANTQSNDYLDIKNKMPLIYPELNDYLRDLKYIKKFYQKLTQLTEEYLELQFDDKLHIYYQYQDGLKCAMTDEIIGGCKSEEEVTLLVKIANHHGWFLKEYQDGDLDFVRTIIQESVSDYKTVELTDEDKDLRMLGEYENIPRQITSYVNQELRKKHKKSDEQEKVFSKNIHNL